MKLTLEQIVRRVGDLPALPQVVAEVLRITEDPDTTVKDLNEAISRDQALAAKVLRLANSAYYGFPRRIGTIVEAVIILGFNTIRNLVLAASVHGILSRELPGYQLARGELWRHSIACAMAARTLARRARFPQPDQAFVAGLLHDIGKLVLGVYVGEAYTAILEKVHKEGLSFVQAEEEVLGFTHAAVGARVADKWNLPSYLVEAIELHHEPARARSNPLLVALTHLADAVSMMMGMGIGGDGMYYLLDSRCLDLLGLTPEDFEAVLAELGDLFADENSFLAGEGH